MRSSGSPTTRPLTRRSSMRSVKFPGIIFPGRRWFPISPADTPRTSAIGRWVSMLTASCPMRRPMRKGTLSMEKMSVSGWRNCGGGPGFCLMWLRRWRERAEDSFPAVGVVPRPRSWLPAAVLFVLLVDEIVGHAGDVIANHTRQCFLLSFLLVTGGKGSRLLHPKRKQFADNALGIMLFGLQRRTKVQVFIEKPLSRTALGVDFRAECGEALGILTHVFQSA